jgi:acetyltransferase-like isoleucine patch superfamily enzyme
VNGVVAAASAAPRIHSTAIIEPGVEVGAGTAIWDAVHVRGPARIGSQCIIGEKTYIAYGVSVGRYVKINAQVYVCTGVTIADHVMISAGVIFTNDRYPRAFADGVDRLADSGPTADTLSTTVHEGATIGAGAVIGPGIDIGPFAMIGMGAVVVKDVPAHGLVHGNPGRLRGYVCVCGQPLQGLPEVAQNGRSGSCARCRRLYSVIDHGPNAYPFFTGVREVEKPPRPR